MTLSPGDGLGAYEIVSTLGAGGMGEVYRARDTRLNRDVAIKILPDALAADPDRLARFTREAQLLAALNHQNVAAIYGVEGTRALVMELVEGEDLSAVIARGPLSWADALPIARQIADALETAHEAGIIHRDLKPANIKIRHDGTVKVLDFGLAKALNPDGAGGSADGMNSPTITARATQLGMVLGTAAYMAPEQARGRTVDRRADIWAFGVVLFEMLTGQRAFEGDDVSITLANVLKEDVRWNRLPADLPASAHRLLKRSLEKDPKRRLSSIGDARLELDDSTASPVIVPTARRSLALPWALAAVTTLAAIYLGALSLGRTSASSNPIWASIPAPADVFSRGMGPAVSPDGKWIVFGASDAKGQDHLWIRSVGGQSAQILQGTQNGAEPFWSPDSKFVAFIRDRKLQTVAAGGGTPQVLADTGNSRGGTWNRDGVVLFVPAPGLGLHRVSATAGGAAVALDAFANPPGTITMYPSFLPDGQRFLFTRVSDSEASINVGSLADGTTTKLLPAFSRAAYVAGYLLFGSKGGLYAQPFDPATLTLSGDRTRIIDFVGEGTGHTVNYSFSASDDGSILAAGNKPFLALSQLVWFDRSGVRQGTLGEPAHLFGFSVAPDRTRVSIEKLDPRLNSIDPWIIDVRTGFTSPLRAASEGALASSPAWSHDNKKLFHSSGHGTLRVSSLAGAKDEAWSIGAHWPSTSAPDGSVLLVSQQGTDTGGDIMIVSITGDHTPKPYLQTPFTESQARFSPDGRFVAYVSNESSRNEVYIQSFPRSMLKIQVSANGGTHPEWNQDGSELYFGHDEPDGTRSLMATRFTGDGVGPAQKLFGGISGFWETNRSGFGVFDNGRRFLMSVLVPVTAPQVITVGHNWMATLPGKR